MWQLSNNSMINFLIKNNTIKFLTNIHTTYTYKVVKNVNSSKIIGIKQLITGS